MSTVCFARTMPTPLLAFHSDHMTYHIDRHPALKNGSTAEHRNAMVRHHPGRCEFFEEDHEDCCRPSHLAWGSSSGNNLDTQARRSVQFTILKTVFRTGIATGSPFLKLIDRK